MLLIVGVCAVEYIEVSRVEEVRFPSNDVGERQRRGCQVSNASAVLRLVGIRGQICAQRNRFEQCSSVSSLRRRVKDSLTLVPWFLPSHSQRSKPASSLKIWQYWSHLPQLDAGNNFSSLPSQPKPRPTAQMNPQTLPLPQQPVIQRNQYQCLPPPPPSTPTTSIAFLLSLSAPVAASEMSSTVSRRRRTGSRKKRSIRERPAITKSWKVTMPHSTSTTSTNASST